MKIECFKIICNSVYKRLLEEFFLEKQISYLEYCHSEKQTLYLVHVEHMPTFDELEELFKYSEVIYL